MGVSPRSTSCRPTVVFLAVLALAISSCGPESPTARSRPHAAGANQFAYSCAEMFIELRKAITALKSSDLPQFHGKELIALLMETGGPDQITTLVLVADGSTSVYYSAGGGLFNAGSLPEVAEVTLSVLTDALGFLHLFEEVQGLPLPNPGQVRFFMVTDDEVLSATAPEEDLKHHRHSLASLYHRCHEVSRSIPDPETSARR